MLAPAFHDALTRLAASVPATPEGHEEIAMMFAREVVDQSKREIVEPGSFDFDPDGELYHHVFSWSNSERAVFNSWAVDQAKAYISAYGQGSEQALQFQAAARTSWSHHDLAAVRNDLLVDSGRLERAQQALASGGESAHVFVTQTDGSIVRQRDADGTFVMQQTPLTDARRAELEAVVAASQAALTAHAERLAGLVARIEAQFAASTEAGGLRLTGAMIVGTEDGGLAWGEFRIEDSKTGNVVQEHTGDGYLVSYAADGDVLTRERLR